MVHKTGFCAHFHKLRPRTWPVISISRIQNNQLQAGMWVWMQLSLVWMQLPSSLQLPSFLLSLQPQLPEPSPWSFHHPFLRPTDVIFLCMVGSELPMNHEPSNQPEFIPLRWRLPSQPGQPASVGLPYLPFSGSPYPWDYMTLVHLCHFCELEEEKQSTPSSLTVVKPAQQQSPFLGNSEAILRRVKW